MARISSSQDSMLEGSIWKGLISFTIPILLGNLFQQLYNTVDSLIVGNFLGKEALAAVSTSSNLIFMFIGLLQGIAVGLGVLIAKHYGAKDREGLYRAVHTGLAFGVAGGLFLTVAGVTLAPQILRWMGTPEDVLPNSIAYFRTYFMGALALFLYNITTGILRSVGDSRNPLYYLILSSLINVVLDLLFIGVFHWGVASAAAATVISQAVSAILCIIKLTQADPLYRLELRKIHFHGPTLKLIFQYGLPAGIQNCLVSLSNVVIQSHINTFGSDAMAGVGAYARLEGFAFLPITCFMMALSTFVGQNLGAKQYDRTKQGTRFGLICCMCLSGALGLVICLFAPHLIALFNDDPNVIYYGVLDAQIVGGFYALVALSHCMAGILRGAGKASVPMAVMLICWCLVRVVYISIMVPIIPDIRVVLSSYPITWGLSSIVFLIYYNKADWVHNFERMEQKQRT